MTDYLSRSKVEWIKASEFPADKEQVYPEHKKYQEFDLHHNEVVYEYGCGGGSDVMSYLRRDNIVTATDIVPKNLEVTKDRVLKLLPDKFNDVNLVLLEDSYPLPFPDNTFEIISSHGVLHHILTPEPIVKEFYRVAKPSCLVYVMLYTTVMYDFFKDNGMIDKFKRTYNITKSEAFGYCTDGIGTPYSRPYSTQEGIDLLEQAGFEVVDYNYWLNDHFCTYKGIKNV